MPERIKIVTDSTSDITPAAAEQKGIGVIPLNVKFGIENYKDRVDIDSATFCGMLKESEIMPMTSLPSPGDFIDFYRQFENDYDVIISIHISSRLSGTYQSACTAASEISGCRVVTVDSGLVSSALQLVVLRAVKAAGGGDCDVETILRGIDNDAKRTKTYFILDTLEYLKKGGRIGAAGEIIGGMLNVKPILSIEDGVIAPVARVRSRKQAVKRVMDLITEHVANPEIIAVGHAVEPVEAGKVRNLLIEKYPGVELVESEIGPVIATHTGPGAVEVSVI